ncbi:MAG: TetR/AcrR family transcriptional regulator [Actinomycetota bacterium]|nr:TetR/AcrR family transcriptional regulator [Actinomycetota bacterium]
MVRSLKVETAARHASGRGAATRQQLIEAAIDTLKQRGFAGASARVIADRARVNQGLIFYHFGSVVGLLVSALDEVSAVRAARYGDAVARATSPSELVGVAESIFREDLEQGHAAVLLAMIAGAASTPDLGRKVAVRIQPWTQFATEAVRDALDHAALGAILPAGDVGFAIVALYLGLEMLAQVGGDRASVDALFDRAKALVPLLARVGAAIPSDETGVVP